MRSLFACLSVTAAVAIGGCNNQNPYYCPLHPGDPSCPNDGSLPPDMAIPCTSNATCTGATAMVCDLDQHTCVQCTDKDHAACVDSTPVCGTDDKCHACTTHADCTSEACLPDGSCGTDANVAYVDPGGTDNGSCTLTEKCTKISAALATHRAYVKLHGTTNELVSITDQNVTFLADPGARLSSTSNGVLLKIDGSSRVVVEDLEISGASGSSNPGVSMQTGNTADVTLDRCTITNNQGPGVLVSSGKLTLSRSTVSLNNGGGVSVLLGSTFDITNNFIYRNGNPSTGGYGGLNLGIATAGSNRLEFNTIVDNYATINTGGVICNVPAFAAPNNLIARNTLNGTANATNQTMGNCTYPTSVVQGDLVGLAFAHPDAPGPFDYRLMTGSTAAVDQATTASTVKTDVIGTARPQGAASDCGAFELVP